MALTNQQVQAAYLAIIGRPAEGSAVTWAIDSFADLASLVSSIIDIRKGGDFSNNKETFVENLYQNLLGRNSDAEGKEFWLKALNDGASYAQVAQGFINAVLGQSQTEDLYKLQNKLGIAEQISAQINTFQGGAAAEATLKELMSTVNANTTFANVEDSVKEFKGQNVDIATVTVQQGAEEPAEGSDENATIFNATLDLAKDGEIAIASNSSFANTLNLSVKGVKDEQTQLASIGTVNGIKTLNITTDTNIKTSNLNSSNVGGATSVTFKGSSVDTFTASSKMDLLDTGTGDDIIILNEKVSTVKAGTGNDNITVNPTAEGVAMSIDGGNGTDTIILTAASSADASLNQIDYSKLTLSNINVISGGTKGTGGSGDGVAILASSQLNNKNYTIASGSVIGTKAASGADFSKLKVEETGSAKLYINDVKSGTIKLNAEDGITETITLAAGAKKVTITNVDNTDKVNVKGIAAIATPAGTASAFENASGKTIADNKAYFVEINDTNISQLTASQVLTAANLQGAASKTAVLAVEAKDGIAFYKLTSNGASTIAADLIEGVQLIGLTGDEVTASTLTLA